MGFAIDYRTHVLKLKNENPSIIVVILNFARKFENTVSDGIILAHIAPDDVTDDIICRTIISCLCAIRKRSPGSIYITHYTTPLDSNSNHAQELHRL
jgi:hypothetical protein